MSTRFSVSKAVITGGAQGIGASIAHRLASEGMSVSVLDVNDVGAKETAERIASETGSEVFGFGCDFVFYELKNIGAVRLFVNLDLVSD